MTFEVETGTGSPTANSYVDLQYMEDYSLQKGDYDWACVEQQQQEIYLQNATLMIDNQYGTQYGGYLATQEQALLWPRTEFIDKYGRTVKANTIPKSLMNAVCEMALNLSAGVDFYEVPENYNVKSKTESVGSLSESTTWFAPQIVSTEQSKITSWLSPILVGTSGQRELVRG